LIVAAHLVVGGHLAMAVSCLASAGNARRLTVLQDQLRDAA
jgi:hypothetical protein